MTKKEAKALLTFRTRVTKALEAVLEQLPEREREYAEAYWAANIRNVINGHVYGSPNIGKALEVLDQ